MAGTDNPHGDWIAAAYRRTVPIPLIGFTAALLTDWTYSNTALLMWSNASSWLIFFGLVGCGAALMIGGLGLRSRRFDLGSRIAMALLFAAFGIGVINFLVHLRDGWTGVVPTGILLSLAGALAIWLAAWLGRTRYVEVRG